MGDNLGFKSILRVSRLWKYAMYSSCVLSIVGCSILVRIFKGINE